MHCLAKGPTSTRQCFRWQLQDSSASLTGLSCFPSLETGLRSHPQHEVMKRQCTGCPGMITFYIKGKLEHATTFLNSLKVIMQ